MPTLQIRAVDTLGRAERGGKRADAADFIDACYDAGACYAFSAPLAACPALICAPAENHQRDSLSWHFQQQVMAHLPA